LIGLPDLRPWWAALFHHIGAVETATAFCSLQKGELEVSL
jgi:hypothetical protein